MQGATLMQGNALQIPLADNSVDLIVTSPPYFALRSYRDGDEHYADQIGSEATPKDFLEALWAATAEMKRVLKPGGSIFVNLGDKYAGSGGHNNNGLTRSLPGVGVGYAEGTAQVRSTRRNAPDRYNQASGGVPAKSLMGLPWRYAIGCIDQLGLILRAEIIWNKPNGLPESVKDRVRRNHEQWFHFTKEPHYFAAVDEIREPHVDATTAGRRRGGAAFAKTRTETADGSRHTDGNPLGKLPGSVWTIATQPLIISDQVKADYDLPDHYAAFPQEWPRRLILGWSPAGVCTVCGEGRRPVTALTGERGREPGGGGTYRAMKAAGEKDTNLATAALAVRVITGYACACTPRTSRRGKQGDWKAGREVVEEQLADDWHSPGVSVPRRPGGFGTKVPTSAGEWDYHLEGWVPPPTTPAVVLDPFAGTGTTVGVARALGRYGVGLDLSFDYARLASWRVFESGHFSKALDKTNAERQGSLL